MQKSSFPLNFCQLNVWPCPGVTTNGPTAAPAAAAAPNLSTSRRVTPALPCPRSLIAPSTGEGPQPRGRGRVLALLLRLVQDFLKLLLGCREHVGRLGALDRLL